MRIPTEFIAVDKFTSVVKNMTAGVSNFSKKTSASIDRFNRKANNAANGMAVAGGAITGAFALAVNSSSNFEKSMSNVSTLVDTNSESMAQMSKDVLNLSKTLPVPIEELTSSLYDIRSAGISAGDAMSTLETSAKLAKAGLSTTGEATNILTSAMNAFASEGMSSDQIANLLFKTVKAGKTNMAELSQAFGANAGTIQSAGVKLADFQAATAALTTTGTPAAQVQNQLRSAIVKLKKPTAEMTKIFKALGVSTDKDLIKKYGTLGGAFQAIQSEADKTGVSMAKAWGSSEALAASTSLLGAQNGAYTDTLKDMQSGTDALTGAFSKQLDTTSSKLQIAKNNMERLSITIGTQVAPILSDLISTIVPVISKFTEWISANPKLTKGVAVFGIGLLALSGIIKGVTLITQGVSMAMKVWAGAQWLLNIAMTANPIGLIIAAIVIVIGLVALAIAKWDSWGQALFVFLGPLGMIINVIMTIKKHWTSILDAFKTEGLIGGFKRLGIVLLDAILSPIQKILELVGKIPGVGKLIGPAVAGIDALKEKLNLNIDAKGPESIKSPEETQKENMQNIGLNGNVNLNIKDKGNNVESSSASFGAGIIPNISTTQGGF
jgi:TP901 family phage tail tape measure protein